MAEAHEAHALLDGASRRIETALGLHFPPTRWRELEHGLGLAARRLGLDDAHTCARQLVEDGIDDAGMQVLVDCLAIGETYFFRDPGLFEELRTRVLPAIIATRRGASRHLRLWSAACSGGEEAYSLAILLALMLPDWRRWRIDILASDVNTLALRKARRGIYNAWSFRGALPAGAQAYLRPLGQGRQEVDPALRALVRIETINLASPCQHLPGQGLDLILCRNVLMYFAEERALQVLTQLGRCLQPDGWLITNAVETPTRGVPGLATAPLDGGLLALRPAGVRTAAPLASDGAKAPEALAPFARSATETMPIAARTPPPAAGPAPAPAATPAPSASAEAAALAAQARSLADQGQLAAARELCLQAQGLDKLDERWPYLLALVLLEAELVDEAAAALQRTLFLAPQHVMAHYTLAGVALRQGRTDAARKQFALAETCLATAEASGAAPQGGGGMSAASLRALVAQAREKLA